MTHPKSILKIKQKCRECEKGKVLDKNNTFSKKFPQYKDCKSCKGTGQQRDWKYE